MIVSILLFFLIILSWHDYKEKMIYNIIPITGSTIGLICNYLVNNLNNALIGLCFGFCFLFIVYWAILKVKKFEGIGFGDVLVSGMMGAFLGFNELYISLCIGFGLGFLFCLISKNKKVALIPFFTFGVIITQLFGVFYEINVFNFN